MKLLAIRTPSNDFGLTNHQSTVWLREKVKPWATLDYHPVHDTKIPEGYDGYILMGEDALRAHSHVGLEDLGYVHLCKDRLQVCTYDVEEASRFAKAQDDDDDNDDEEVGDKDSAPTRRKNWLFWIQSDIAKLAYYPRFIGFETEIVTYPKIQRTTAFLKSIVDHELVIDIETLYKNQAITCIGLQDLTAKTPPIVVPIYNYAQRLAYEPDDIYDFFIALSIAFSRNIVIGHNLAFDLMVLAAKYKVVFGERLMDTMIMHHRVFQVEKSLGHVIRRWSNFPWHKDENIANPRTPEQERQHHIYNGRDVHRTGVVYKQLKYLAQQHPCLASSMSLGCRAVYESLCTTLRGMAVDVDLLAKAKWEAMRKRKVYVDCCRILSGDETCNPASSTWCIKYFHGKLMYPVVKRTESGAPSLEAKALYKLAAKQDNPLLRFVIKAREAAKEESLLEYIPWSIPPR